MTTLTVPTLEEIQQEKARRHLKDFARLCWRSQDEDGKPIEGYVEGRHTDLIIEKLEAVERGDVTRLIIEMPPRHGKSEHVSRIFPPWYLGRNPDNEIILASYGQDLADDMSADARGLFEEISCPLWDLELSDTSASVRKWRVGGHRGGMKATGIRTSITGRGSRVMLIDDYVKDAVEAQSEAIRERNWNWYQSTIRTRLAPGGAIIVMATRWHKDDLIGRLLKQAERRGIEWDRLRLPAMAGDADPMGRKAGEPLWPEFGFDQAWLDDIRKEIDNPWVWSALYQQSPMDEDGGVFQKKDFRYFKVIDGSDSPYDDSLLLQTTHPDATSPKSKTFLRRECWRFATVDLAASEKEMADYTVICVCEVTPYGDVLILDVIREHLAGPDQGDRISEIYEQYELKKVVVESIGYQLTMIQELSRKGLPVVAIQPDKDKVARAIPAGTRVKSHNVYFKHGADWLSDFEEELLSFPLGEHDDQVDAFAYAVQSVPIGNTNNRGFRSGGGGRGMDR